MQLKLIVSIFVCAVLLAGCSQTSAVSASRDKQIATARAIIGTSLVGVRGATQADQDGISNTVAGLCGARVWTASECLKHDQKLKAL